MSIAAVAKATNPTFQAPRDTPIGLPLAPMEPPVPTAPMSYYALITPEVAAHWLATYNTHNRNLRTRWTESLTDMIRAGAWRPDNDAISFDTNQALANGQHRLTAIAAAETSVVCAVAFGLSPDAQDSMDTGRARLYSDALKLRGEANTLNLAAAVRAVFLWERGQAPGTSGYQPVNSQLDATLSAHPDLREHVRTAGHVHNVFQVPMSILSLAVMLFAHIDAEDAEFFWSRVIDGAGLGEESPILRLRNSYTIHGQGRMKKPRHVLLAETIKAWNAYRDGVPMKLLLWKSGGAKPEPFPQPR